MANPEFEILRAGDIQYMKSPRPISMKILLSNESTTNHMDFAPGISHPLTILNYPYPKFAIGLFNEIVEWFLDDDDVFNRGFLDMVVLPKSMGTLGDGEIGSESKLGFYDDEEVALPDGPYFWRDGYLFPALRLYSDPFGAFVCGITPSPSFPSSYTSLLTALIPIPSRLSSPPPTPALPLSGLRFAVKDIFDLRGIKTTASSKAYAATYEAAEETASVIQKLIELGAVMVGKTKTAPLASGLAAGDWVDGQCPWNPRGDGYLEVDCSSSGSAVAVAGYEWLDFTVGSDTLGSMVGPAAANGVYGIRPTHGLQKRDGTVLVSTLYDTAGIFARDVHTFKLLTDVWYGQIPKVDTSKDKFPSKILFPKERFEPYPEASLKILLEFISDLEKAIGVQKTPLDIGALWEEYPPAGISEPLEEYIETTLAHIQLYDCYHNNEKFRNDHKARFGYEPYVEPMIRYKWDLGAKLTKEDFDKACSKREIFRKFLLEQVFVNGAVMLLPGGYPDTSYRDEYPESFEEHGRRYQGFGLKNTAFSVLGGLPCISFPIGEVKYKSKITNMDEWRPISLMLLGQPGMDSLLIGLIKMVLEASGRPVSVKTGNRVF